MISAFAELCERIGAIDARLAATVRDLDAGWATGEPRDRELSELAASVILRASEAGIFTLSGMAEGFAAFAHDFHERQADFLHTGSYRAKSYETVAREVYANDAYMRAVYYPALVASYVASPNYRHLLRELDRALVSWEAQGVARVLEIAAGHAFLSLFALHHLPRAEGVATDIAGAAVGFAAALHAASGWADGRFRAVTADVLDGSKAVGEPFDAVICCELLEHVPRPERFLQAARSRLRPEGLLFVSAAVRMESVDHLTLFASVAEVAELLDACGFTVVRDASVPFVKRRPRDAAHWQKLLTSPTHSATFVAECRAKP